MPDRYFGEYPVSSVIPDVVLEDVEVSAVLQTLSAPEHDDADCVQELLIDERIANLPSVPPLGAPHEASVAGRLGGDVVLRAFGRTTILDTPGERRLELSPEAKVVVDGIFRANSQLILRFLMRRTNGDVPAAEDLTQDTFERVARAIANDSNLMASFDNARAIQSWVFRIATNVHNDYYRRGQALNRKGAGLTSLEVLLDAAGEHRAELGDDSEQERVVNGALLAQTWSQLSPTHRNVLVLYEVFGYSIGEVADIVGATRDAVKMRLTRARERFAEVYARVGGDSVNYRRLPIDRRAVYATETPGFGTIDGHSA